MAPSGNLFKLVAHKNAAAALRTARVAAGMSGGEAAKIAQMPQPDYSRLETGKKQYMTERTKARLEKLTSQLNVKMNFARADWSEIRQKGGVRRVPGDPESAPARQEPVQRRQHQPGSDFWENFNTLTRLYQQGVLPPDAFKAAVIQVVHNAVSPR